MLKEKRSRLIKYFPLLAAGYFVVLTILMTWPLVTRMRYQMAGQVGDNIYFVWMIGWFKKALFELHVDPFNVWFLNYPEGWSLAYTEITPAQLLLALPFSLAASPTFAYNAAHLLSFALSGLIMALWVKRLSGSFGGGLLAGTAYAFLPYHFAHFLIGHLNLSGLQWFPLFFWGFFDLLLAGEGMDSSHVLEKSSSPGEEAEKEKDDTSSSNDSSSTQTVRLGKGFPWKAAVMSGIGLGLIALTSQYYLYMTILIAAFIWGVYVFFFNKPALREKKFWYGWLMAGLISLPLIIVAVAPYVSLAGQGGLPDRELGVVRPYSAGLTDFLVPSTDHFLWGQWVGDHFNRDLWPEATLYVGIVAAALAVISWKKLRRTKFKNLLLLMFAGGALALLLAMGTDLHWNGAPVELTTPGFLQGFYSKPTIPIPLPGWLLFKFFPFYAKLRALMRFGIFVLLFISVAAGLGTASILKQISPRWKFSAAVGLILLVLIDFYPGAYTQFATVQPRPVDTWLADQPGDGAVAQMPFAIAEDQEHTYYTLEYNKPYIGGFFNAFPPSQYKRVKPVLMNFPDAESVQLLRELQVRWVLVDPAYYLDWNTTKNEIESFGLTEEAQPGGIVVFTLQGEK